ncbi:MULTISPECIES: alpha/beta hydrolase family protein [Micrococcaceae]|uniref:alpha/beta hydrolase family protein n=1 Tax=unclassified Kocuria TaxID=2649579 RepID=UPI0010112FFC|nr:MULTISPECIES: alpha/beta fold hydrolase [unclassified Kocuria]
MFPETANKSDRKIVPQAVELRSVQGLPISVTSWGDWETAQGVALIVPAIATRARHYNGFARWLADQGLVAVSFDYSGFGESLVGSLKDSDVNILNWADDARTVIDWIGEQGPTLPVTWIGHSLGGQLLGLAGDRGVTKSIFVASGVGSGWKSPWQTAVPGMAMFFLVGPVAQKICGYYPGRKLRFFGNLPSGVMSQWTRWVAYPRYILGERPWLAPEYAAVESPITAISFTDDVVMSKSALRMLLSFYSGARRLHFRYSPRDLGVDSIGHMGPFRAASAAIWKTVIAPHLAKNEGPPRR